MAKADASLAQAMVERCVIKAPFSGRVVERKVNRYEYVAEGTPLIEIIDDKNLEVEMILPSSSLVWLKIGHPFSLHVEELGKIFQGKIERIVSKVDPVSQSLKLYGSIDVNVEHLYPGMSGTIKIQP
jgi:multidrug resistance efflux pump